MQKTADELARIGFAQSPRDASVWRVRPFDRPLPAGAEPAVSPALQRWREMLGRDPLPPSYRITRIDGAG